MSDVDWEHALERVLAEPQRIGVVYQPIADVRKRDVCGYEALARFPEAPDLSPLSWFDAAARLGCAGALEAQVVQSALVVWPLVGAGRFVSVNVTPQALLTPEVQSALAAEQRHDRLVVELGAFDGTTPAQLHNAAGNLRESGIALAITAFDENVGLSPDYVKVPVARLGEDGAGAGPSAKLIAQGVETDAQLEGIRRSGPALAQGYALARPASAPGIADPLVRRALTP